METNRTREMWLCNLAFQEYNIRKNIIELINKKTMVKDDKSQNNIEFEIEKLTERANYLLNLREENKKCL